MKATKGWNGKKNNDLILAVLKDATINIYKISTI